MENMEHETNSNIPLFNRFSVLAAFKPTSDLPSNSACPAKKTSPEVNKDPRSDVIPPVERPSSPGPSVNNIPTRSVKPLPLYISNFAYNIAKFERELASDFGKAFQIKYLGNKIRLQFDEVDAFKKFKLALSEGNIPHFTFSINSERGLAMVLKDLPETPPEEILEELKTKGLCPISCVSLAGNGNKKQSLFHIYNVNFPPGTSPTSVTKINAIFSTRIYWEKLYTMFLLSSLRPLDL